MLLVAARFNPRYTLVFVEVGHGGHGKIVRSDPLSCDILVPLDVPCEPCLAGQFDTRKFDTVSDALALRMPTAQTGPQQVAEV